MGAPPDREPAAVFGFHRVHQVAQSYLGSLWVALDQRKGEPGQPVLLRHIELPDDTAPEALQRVACAGRDAMALNHENVLPVLAVLQRDDTLALAYAYAEAEPLRALQTGASERGLSFPVEVSLRIVLDLLRGVKALHGALLGWPSAPPFGGLSPDSVLVSRDGRTRLCDPLIASCATLLEGFGTDPAKFAYAAPEQVHATSPLAATSDVFSCAALLWELLTGRRLLAGSKAVIERKLLEHALPKLSDNLRDGREVSPALIDVVERSLSADAGRRPQSPALLASELEQCGHPVATLADVAQFVDEVAGARFDQRSDTIRSRAPAVHALLETAGEVTAHTGQRKAAKTGAHSEILSPLQAKPASATMIGVAPPRLEEDAAPPVPRSSAGRRLVPLPPGRGVLRGATPVPLPGAPAPRPGPRSVTSSSLERAAKDKDKAKGKPAFGAATFGTLKAPAAAPRPMAVPSEPPPDLDAWPEPEPGVGPLPRAELEPAASPVPASAAPEATGTAFEVTRKSAEARRSRPETLPPESDHEPTHVEAVPPDMDFEPAAAEAAAQDPDLEPTETESVAAVPAREGIAPAREDAAPRAARSEPPRRAPAPPQPKPPAARRANAPVNLPAPERSTSAASPPAPAARVEAPVVTSAPRPTNKAKSNALNGRTILGLGAQELASLAQAQAIPAAPPEPAVTDSAVAKPAVAKPAHAAEAPLAVELPKAAERAIAAAAAPEPDAAPPVPIAGPAPGMVPVVPLGAAFAPPGASPVPPPAPRAPFALASSPPPQAPARRSSSLPPASDAFPIDLMLEDGEPAALPSRASVPSQATQPSHAPRPNQATRPSGWSHAPPFASKPRKRAIVASILATIALGTAVGIALLLRPEDPAAPAAAATSTAPAPLPPAIEPPPEPPAPAPSTKDSADAPSEPAPEPSALPPAADANPSSVLPPGDFAGSELADAQLVQLFGFEPRAELPSCAKRLGTSARRHKRDAKKSKAQLVAARRELTKGNDEKALRHLCSATAYSAVNGDAWQSLAELTLRLGDPAQAKHAVDQALKRKPTDPIRLGIKGDILALQGDLTGARALWARSAHVKGSGAERQRRLVALFGSIADRKLRARAFASALAYYRRAVVLSAGAQGPSTGMREALRSLGQEQAMRAWSERIALAFPSPASRAKPSR